MRLCCGFLVSLLFADFSLADGDGASPKGTEVKTSVDRGNIKNLAKSCSACLASGKTFEMKISDELIGTCVTSCTRSHSKKQHTLCFGKKSHCDFLDKIKVKMQLISTRRLLLGKEVESAVWELDDSTCERCENEGEIFNQEINIEDRIVRNSCVKKDECINEQKPGKIWSSCYSSCHDIVDPGLEDSTRSTLVNSFYDNNLKTTSCFLQSHCKDCSVNSECTWIINSDGLSGCVNRLHFDESSAAEEACHHDSSRLRGLSTEAAGGNGLEQQTERQTEDIVIFEQEEAAYAGGDDEEIPDDCSKCTMALESTTTKKDFTLKCVEQCEQSHVPGVWVDCPKDCQAVKDRDPGVKEPNKLGMVLDTALPLDSSSCFTKRACSKCQTDPCSWVSAVSDDETTEDKGCVIKSWIDTEDTGITTYDECLTGEPADLCNKCKENQRILQTYIGDGGATLSCRPTKACSNQYYPGNWTECYDDCSTARAPLAGAFEDGARRGFGNESCWYWSDCINCRAYLGRLDKQTCFFGELKTTIGGKSRTMRGCIDPEYLPAAQENDDPDAPVLKNVTDCLNIRNSLAVAEYPAIRFTILLSVAVALVISVAL